MDQLQAANEKLAKAERLMQSLQEHRVELQAKINELETTLTGRDAKIRQLRQELQEWEKDQKYRDRFARADEEVARLQTLLAKHAVKIEE